MTGILTALPEELPPLLAAASASRREGRGAYRARIAGTEVLLAATGEGPARARRGAGDLIGRHGVDAVVGTGLAGALSPALRRGEVVAAREVHGEAGEIWPADPGLLARASRRADRIGVVFSTGRLLGTAGEKGALCAAHPEAENAVTDLESAAWADAARAAGVPFLALRAVLDTAGEDLPQAVLRSFHDGRLSRPGVVARGILRPRELPRLLELRGRTRRTMARIAALLPAILRTDA